MLLAGLVALVALATLWASAHKQAGDRSAQLARVSAQAAAAEKRAAAAAPFVEFATLARNRVDTVTQLSATRFDWAHALREVSRVVPADVWLMNLSGSSGNGSEAPSPTTSAAPAPTINMVGCTRSQAKVARLMARLRTIDGVRGVTLKSSEKPDSKGDGDCPANRASDPALHALDRLRRPGRSRRRRRLDRPGLDRGIRRGRGKLTGRRRAARRYRLEGRLMSAQIRILLGVAVTAAAIAALWLLAVAPEREQAVEPRRPGRGGHAGPRRSTDPRGDRRGRALALRPRLRDRRPARQGRSGQRRRAVARLPARERRAPREGRLPRRQRARPPGRTAPRPPTASAAAKTSGGVEPAPFSFRFEGDFFGLQRLLNQIDRFTRVDGTQVAVNGRLLTIDGVTMSPGRSGLPKIQGMIIARAYVADLPAALPSSAPAAGTAPAGTPTATTASQVTP